MDDVGSPGNGFDEITDLLKDDDSNLTQDLDLFLLDKDGASDYVFDGFGSDKRFNFSFNNEQEQSQLAAPELPDSRVYGSPRNPNDDFNSSSRTDGNTDVLHNTDTDVLHNEEMLELTSLENPQNEDDTENLYSGYLRESDSQVDLASINDDAPRNVELGHPQGGEGVDIRDSLRTDAMYEDQSDRVEYDVPVHHIEKLHISPSSCRGDVESDGGNVNSFRNSRDCSKELNNSLSSVQQGTSFVPVQVPPYHIISASDGLQECWQGDSINLVLDHSFQGSVKDSESSPASLQRSQHTLDDPAKHVATPEIDSPRVKMSVSKSPIRQRICDSNSEERSFRSRNRQKRSSEMGDCLYQSPGSSTRHVSREINFSSRKHKHELTERAGLRVSTSSRRSPTSTRTRASPRGSHREEERSRSDSASPIRGRNLHAGNKRERNKSRSRSPHARDHHRKRYTSRRKSPAWSSSSQHRSRESRHSPLGPSRTGSRNPGACLFVAGFPFSTTERELERKFSQYGRVRTVRVIRDQRSGISRGYGFVTLRKDEEADTAIRALHKTYWSGRLILVEKSFRR